MLPHVNLRRLREAKGWTQAEAATAAGVTLRRYLAWETGRTELRLSGLESLADAFGITPAELLAALLAGKQKPKK
jgi:transcriptional regulator with XRE-family HTH domain